MIHRQSTDLSVGTVWAREIDSVFTSASLSQTAPFISALYASFTFACVLPAQIMWMLRPSITHISVAINLLPKRTY